MTNEEKTLLLRKAYIALQKASNISIGIAIKTDSLRAKLRDELAEIYGQDSQTIQEDIEQIARQEPFTL